MRLRDISDETALLAVQGPKAEGLIGQLTSLGIDPSRQRILVVKAAIAYKAAYAPVAARVIEVDTPGLTAVKSSDKPSTLMEPFREVPSKVPEKVTSVGP